MTDTETPASSARSREIAEALARHGLGYVVDTVGLERFVPFQRGLLGHPRRDAPYTRPEHVAMALSELGATFIKLGQILSTRADLLPPDYQTELAKLQDGAPPVSAVAVRAALTAELGRSPEEAFAAFEFTPLAAASIGQAHAATLADGTEVVVKVRRPGVSERIEADLTILHSLATTASRRWEIAEQYDVVGLAREFSQTLRAELDYLREARTAERFAANFASDDTIHIPRVFHEVTTAHVLTLERIRGIKISDRAALDAAGIDRAALAKRATTLFLRMVFDHGLFHADPHPGNMFVQPDGRIGLIDFGMVGVIDATTQEQLAAVLVAVMGGDHEQLVDALLELGFARRRVDRAALRRDLDQLLASYAGQPIGEIAISTLLNRVFAIMRQHRLLLPPNLALLFKALVMSEGTGVLLDPSFRLTAALQPFVERLLVRQYSPVRVARRLGRAGLEAARLGVDTPQQLRRIIADIERGGLEIGMRPEGFDPVLNRIERLINRLVLGIIAAAFIVGLAVLMAVYHPGGSLEWLAWFFMIGFAAMLVLVAFLMWRIVLSRKS